jgi:phosphoribosylaminoimidazole carboxylase
VEIEHVDAATMEKLEQQGVDCQPKASTIRIIQVCLFWFPELMGNVIL